MKNHFIVALFVGLLMQACGTTKTPSQEGSSPWVPPSVEIKDKTAPPDLRPNLPALVDLDGWSVVKTTAINDIPNATPSPAEVFYKAQKDIDGRMRTVAVAFGDITGESGAIVNAANEGLLGGGGIDGIIHDHARVVDPKEIEKIKKKNKGIADEANVSAKEILNFKKANGADLMKKEAIAYKKHHDISSLKTGSAMVTHPYGLDQKITMVVFTAGPNIAEGEAPTDEQKIKLYSAVYNSLLKASEYQAKSVSVPAISTGIFNFPMEEAAELFFSAIFQFFADNPETSIDNVRLTNFDAPTVRKIGERFLALFP